MFRQLFGCCVITTVWAPCLYAQFQPPSSYQEFYRQQLSQAPPARSLVSASPTAYLYDKYFYHNPAISPYTNLYRRGGAGGSSYQTYVRPEIERRQAAVDAQFKAGAQRQFHTSRSTGLYENHWYGGWKNRR